METLYNIMMSDNGNGASINAPYLIKPQVVEPRLNIFIAENNEWVIKYNGAIDDNGAEPDKVINKYAADAVDALLKGSEVKVKETKSIGCQILFRR